MIRDFNPWLTARPIPADRLRDLRRRAIFECCKWDPQVEDVDTLAPLALVLKQSAWCDLRRAAETLAEETLALERALVSRPELLRALALPRQFRKALSRLQITGSDGDHLRVMRFDFHPTAAGWRVSEANTDVPGGYNEASGWTSLVGEHVQEGVLADDPAARVADAIRARVPTGGTVAMVHATAYTDDRQAMTFLSRKLDQRGLRCVLAAPDHLFWRDGRALIRTDWHEGPADFVFRFFPAEWLPNLPRGTDWTRFLGQTLTPQSNPATALLSQSKRWPLVLGQTGLDLPAWDRFLPETRDPRQVDWAGDPGWVLKPALGRVGEFVGIEGVTPPREWKMIRRSVRWGARHWVAQRRFSPLPVLVQGASWHVCVGVYTVDGRAAGIYARIAPEPLINHLARDVAVLVEPAGPRVVGPAHEERYETIGAF